MFAKMLGTSIQTFLLGLIKYRLWERKFFLLLGRENSIPEDAFGKLYQKILARGFITINFAGESEILVSYPAVSLISWGKGTSLKLVGQPFGDMATIKVPYRAYVLLHQPPHLVPYLFLFCCLN